jgi:hypothetical protein
MLNGLARKALAPEAKAVFRVSPDEKAVMAITAGGRSSW